jgi:hypothetical protein
LDNICNIFMGYRFIYKFPCASPVINCRNHFLSSPQAPIFQYDKLEVIDFDQLC